MEIVIKSSEAAINITFDLNSPALWQQSMYERKGSFEKGRERDRKR